MREFLRKHLFFKSQKVAATGYYDIENPLPDMISKPRRFFFFLELLGAACRLSGATGSQKGLILILKKSTLRKYVITC